MVIDTRRQGGRRRVGERTEVKRERERERERGCDERHVISVGDTSQQGLIYTHTPTDTDTDRHTDAQTADTHICFVHPFTHICTLMHAQTDTHGHKQM